MSIIMKKTTAALPYMRPTATMRCDRCGCEGVFFGYRDAECGAVILRCHRCGSRALTALTRCTLCHEHFAAKEAETVCPDCQSQLDERFQKLLAQRFDHEQREALNAIYDGKTF